MKIRTILTLVATTLATATYAQVNEVNFNHQLVDFTSPPRTQMNPMSIRLWDSYNNGGPTAYGTILQIYGRSGHQTTQLNFGGWDQSKIRYREAFYADSEWNEWITLLDSKNDLESTGSLKVSGTGPHFLLDGSFGVGIASPRDIFDLKDANASGVGIIIDNGYGEASKALRFFNNSTEIGRIDVKGRNTSVSNMPYMSFDLYNTDNSTLETAMFIDKHSNIGVGTTNPNGNRLAVNGTIRAKEVIVETGWSDFVFEDSYTLRSLAEVETHIKEHGHLPDVPSAAVVESEGLSVGEAQKIMMQKIEELTLYVIEQDKKIAAQDLRIKELESN